MAAGIFGEADSDGEREDPARSRLPQQHGQRASRGEEQGHAARQRRQDKGDQPTVPPGLDEERFGDPIKPGEEIAETEEKSNNSGGFQPLPEPVVPRVATVEQPGECAESDEQHGPDMQRREGEHREGAHQHREQGAARAREAGDPSGGADHAAWLINAGWSRMAEGAFASPAFFGKWMRSFLIRRGSASSTSNSMPLG